MLPGGREPFEWCTFFRFLPQPQKMSHVTLVIVSSHINERGSNIHVVGLRGSITRQLRVREVVQWGISVKVERYEDD